MIQLRVTLDTNILASALAVGVRTSPPATIVRAWLDSRFVLIYSAHILSELDRTMAKRYFAQRVTAAELVALFVAIRAQGRLVDPYTHLRNITADPADNLVLATALAGAADYLVTGDAELLALVRHDTVSIVTAAQFVQALEL